MPRFQRKQAFCPRRPALSQGDIPGMSEFAPEVGLEELAGFEVENRDIASADQLRKILRRKPSGFAESGEFAA